MRICAAIPALSAATTGGSGRWVGVGAGVAVAVGAGEAVGVEVATSVGAVVGVFVGSLALGTVAVQATAKNIAPRRIESPLILGDNDRERAMARGYWWMTMLPPPRTVEGCAFSSAPSWLSYTTLPVARSQILIRIRSVSVPPPPLVWPSTAVSRKP
jgi:hypothetical protein